ncbi:uncharacterized protein LOC126234487 [Schistocerca nitens]|uniref:uncharacterized protein LOC126234487 n=1 Tax=Schistocerca nitens TaxID=7011 RepID=UPI0021180106|nr:uncharacterized protein LOC126234487 [Schistocerca nitens]
MFSMKFRALLVVAVLAAPTSAVFSRESASDDSSVTEAPCPGPCPATRDPVCATFDNRYYYYSFSNYCMYQQCLCTLNYQFPLVPLFRCFFKVRNVCPARGKLRQLRPNEDDDDLSYSPHLEENNLRSTAQGYQTSSEQSGEVFD